MVLLKIAVIGDTHGSKKSLQIIARVFQGVDFFVHTGDYWRDGKYLENMLNLPVLTVKGNCDFGQMTPELVFKAEGSKIYLTHGHALGVKYSILRLEERARELGAHYCIYGHTHIPSLEYRQGITYLNPGSLTYPRSGERYAGILMECLEGRFSCQFMDVN